MTSTTAGFHDYLRLAIALGEVQGIAMYAGIVAMGEWAVRCDEQHVLDAYCGDEDFDGSPDPCPCPTCGAGPWEPCAPGCSEDPYGDNW